MDISLIAPNIFVKDIYDFALLIGGMLAFGAIVYGAARYTLAAGNPSAQHEGKIPSPRHSWDSCFSSEPILCFTP